MTGAGAGPPARCRLLLSGDASARPDGLERALTRAGFQLGEAPAGPDDAPPDAIVTTVAAVDGEQLRELLCSATTEPPRIVVFASDDRAAPAAALALGAADALAAPVHLAELCARIAARIRDRQVPVRTPHEAGVRESLRALIDEARSPLLPDEVAQALVRRLSRALELAHCSLVVTGPGENAGRVVADLADGRSHTRLDLARYPEIADAIRTRRALTMPGLHPPASSALAGVDTEPRAATMIVLPVVIDEAVAAVLLMRTRDTAPSLSAHQLDLAVDLAAAAARALVGNGDGHGTQAALTSRAAAAEVRVGAQRISGGQPPGSFGSVCGPPSALERRLREELERARRYSLGFSLILLEPWPPATAPAMATMAWARATTAGASTPSLPMIPRNRWRPGPHAADRRPPRSSAASSGCPTSCPAMATARSRSCSPRPASTARGGGCSGSASGSPA